MSMFYRSDKLLMLLFAKATQDTLVSVKCWFLHKSLGRRSMCQHSERRDSFIVCVCSWGQNRRISFSREQKTNFAAKEGAGWKSSESKVKKKKKKEREKKKLNNEDDDDNNKQTAKRKKHNNSRQTHTHTTHTTHMSLLIFFSFALVRSLFYLFFLLRFRSFARSFVCSLVCLSIECCKCK